MTQYAINNQSVDAKTFKEIESLLLKNNLTTKEDFKDNDLSHDEIEIAFDRNHDSSFTVEDIPLLAKDIQKPIETIRNIFTPLGFDIIGEVIITDEFLARYEDCKDITKECSIKADDPYAPLFANIDFCLKVIKNEPALIRLATISQGAFHWLNKTYFFIIAKNDPRIIPYLLSANPVQFMKSAALVDLALAQDQTIINHPDFDATIFTNEDFLKELVFLQDRSANNLPILFKIPQLRESESFLKSLLILDWTYLYFLEPSLPYYDELVKIGAAKNPMAILHASENLLNDSFYIASVLAKAKITFPNSIATTPVEYIRKLQEITHLPERFASFQIIETLYKHRCGPVKENEFRTVILYPTYDYNGALMNSNITTAYLTDPNSHVYYFEINTEDQMGTAFDTATGNGQYQVPEIVFAAHANPHALHMGNIPLKPDGTLIADRDIYLLNSLDESDPWFKKFTKAVPEEGHVYFMACSTGGDPINSAIGLLTPTVARHIPATATLVGSKEKTSVREATWDPLKKWLTIGFLNSETKAPAETYLLHGGLAQ